MNTLHITGHPNQIYWVETARFTGGVVCLLTECPVVIDGCYLPEGVHRLFRTSVGWLNFENRLLVILPADWLAEYRAEYARLTQHTQGVLSAT